MTRLNVAPVFHVHRGNTCQLVIASQSQPKGSNLGVGKVGQIPKAWTQNDSIFKG